MRANVSDRLVVRGRHVGDPQREAVIEEVHGPEGAPPYVVRWGDGHRSTFFPSADTVVEHHGVRRPGPHPEPGGGPGIDMGSVGYGWPYDIDLDAGAALYAATPYDVDLGSGTYGPTGGAELGAGIYGWPDDVDFARAEDVARDLRDQS
jgi:hypothetical protein